MKRICVEENGHVVLLGIFDSVDDTVLVKKALLTVSSSHFLSHAHLPCPLTQEVVLELAEICDSHIGRHVILYLLSPRSPRHFSPQYVDLLTPGDGNAHSKKAMPVRWSELQGGVAKALVTLATEQASIWCRSRPRALLLLETVRALRGKPL